MSAKRIFLSAGEASGDLHAAHLVRAIRRSEPEWSFVGFGGREMAGAGVELRADLVEHAVIGVRKVITHLGSLLGLAARFYEELRRDPPDAVVLVDFPGFNLNLARIARRVGVPVIYFICPQVWAWGPWRIRRVARRVDLLLVITPFEEELYRRHHAEVHYVGNPVFDPLAEIEARPLPAPLAECRPFLALFPGSRPSEVQGTMAIMLETARRLREERPDLAIRISCHRPALREIIDRALASYGDLEAEVVEGATHDLQRGAWLSLVVSGTATLEQGYFGTPMVVLYPLSRLERRVFSFFAVCPYFALANLFAGCHAVPEIFVSPAETDVVVEAARELLEGEKREAARRALARIRAHRTAGGAAVEAARRVVSYLGGDRPDRGAAGG